MVDPLTSLLARIPRMTWEQIEQTLDRLRDMRVLADRTETGFQEFLRDTDLCFGKLGERRYEIVSIPTRVAPQVTGR